MPTRKDIEVIEKVAKHRNADWLEIIEAIIEQIENLRQKSRSKERAITYDIGLVPDDDIPEQEAYLHSAQKLFEKMSADGLIKDLTFPTRTVKDEVTEFPMDLLQSHFLSVPARLLTRLRAYRLRLLTTLSEKALKKNENKRIATTLRLKNDCLVWGTHRVPVESERQLGFADMLYKNRKELRGARIIKKGSSISANETRTSLKLSKKQFSELLKYLRRKILVEFQANGLNAKITNTSRGNGKYQLVIHYT